MRRAAYSNTIAEFLAASPDAVVGALVTETPFGVEQEQRDAWIEEIAALRNGLRGHEGSVYLEYAIPRMGLWVDALLIIGPVIFVMEFKTGDARSSEQRALDQVCDYALDLKNFHETSHSLDILPVLVASGSKPSATDIEATPHDDRLYRPVRVNASQIGELIDRALSVVEGQPIDVPYWAAGRYSPTPTIVEAATALYRSHSVIDISRTDAGAINLSRTSDAIGEIIARSARTRRKSICFVTGVPGAGKTLVGLNVATKYMSRDLATHSVFLSGNGPLVNILQEALARDKIQREKAKGVRVSKRDAHSEVKAFIQNVHHFRDECLRDQTRPPVEHVALFDEAQRAWDLRQTESFMRRKKKIHGFKKSEPEFLISCMDRHPWAVVVCLVGGGQEINTGEAGIGEWIDAITRRFPDWDVYISSCLTDSEYSAGCALELLKTHRVVRYLDDLHLAVSMRSFRAEHVSRLVKSILDRELEAARRTLSMVVPRYPIVLTRDIRKAKMWLRQQARGSERYGIVVSSQAERLKPYAMDVRSPMNPVHWFLNGKEDVRSSYYLEDVGTEFAVQGLELDWVCVAWDGDFRYTPAGWDSFSFRGSKWQKIRKHENQTFQKNAYRVLLTRARQGMVIMVPEGDKDDHTRKPEFYDSTYAMLRSIGLPEV